MEIKNGALVACGNTIFTYFMRPDDVQSAAAQLKHYKFKHDDWGHNNGAKQWSSG